MNNSQGNVSFFPKIFDFGNFKLKPESLSRNQIMILWGTIILTVVIKIIVIPYNMMDMGDSATRVWNALWWAQKPFFAMPESGYPGWFYLMGPIIMITKEFFYTSAIVMILLMTLAGYYVFKTVLILTDFRTAFITFLIFILNPVIFRLNFEPYAQQPFLTMACVMFFFFIKALGHENSKKYFIISGLFAFLGLFQRFEILFLVVPLCLVAFLSKKEGRWHFIGLALFFQIVWLALSQVFYGTPFKPFNVVSEYVDPLSIQGLSMGVRLKGFFMPYYFLVFGLTVILFWYFMKGVFYSKKNFPAIVTIVLLIGVFMPALQNGSMSLKSTLYYMTHYMYFTFYFAPVFAGIGLSKSTEKYKSSVFKAAFVGIVIFTCIPLSYLKELVPQKFNKMFPKVIEFVATTEDPDEARVMIKFIDEHVKEYPALIFDVQNSASSVYYIPYRTMLPASPAEGSMVMISGYNIPVEKEALRNAIREFMLKNKAGMVMTKKSGTTMSEIFTELTSNKQYVRNDFVKAVETEKWVIYLYK